MVQKWSCFFFICFIYPGPIHSWLVNTFSIKIKMKLFKLGFTICGLNQNKLRYWSRPKRLIFLPSSVFLASQPHGDKLQIHIYPLYSLHNLFLPLIAIQVLPIAKDLDVNSKVSWFSSKPSFSLSVKIPNPVALSTLEALVVFPMAIPWPMDHTDVLTIPMKCILFLNLGSSCLFQKVSKSNLIVLATEWVELFVYTFV